MATVRNVTTLKRELREGLTEVVTFDQQLQEGRGGTRWIMRNSSLGRDNSKRKGSGAGTRLVHLRISSEANATRQSEGEWKGTK